jgi:alpha-tubulin suppressor-like RCC1 family protein
MSKRTWTAFGEGMPTLWHCLILCWLAGEGSRFSLEGRPASGRVIGWNYTAFVPNDLPPNLTNITAISVVAAGNYYCQNLALRDDGTVVAWGKNSLGQARTNVPAGLRDVIAVAAGTDHYMALKSDGTVVSWRDTTVLPAPVSVTNVTAIAAGPGGYSLALTASGEVIPWTSGSVNYVLPAGLDSNVSAIAAANSSFLALKSNGTVVAWGLNNLGQTDVPAGISNLSAVAVDYIHSVGLKSDGTVVSWGHSWNGEGQDVPAGLSNVVAIAAGGIKGSHTLVLKSDGTVSSWGAAQTNIAGGLSNVVAIAAGDYYNLAIVTDLRISGFDFANQQSTIRFRSFADRQYAVEYSTNLSSTNWSSLQGNLPGTGGDVIVTDTNATSSKRFYRLRQW